MDLSSLCAAFGVRYKSHEIFHNGHINDTFIVTAEDEAQYVLQKINKNVFKKPEELMSNIISVSSYIEEKLKTPENRGKAKTLRFLKTADGSDFYIDTNGEYWRCYIFVANTFTLNHPEQKGDFYQSAYAFGFFQHLLCDFPAEKLYETIPDFHNTPKRFEAFKEALEKDPMGRTERVKKEIDFCLSRERDTAVLTDALRNGELFLKVTHNDTKLNNVLLDAETRKGVCVIDLDTIMPGLVVNDFGDSIRFGASTAAEDEKDLHKVSVSPELFEEYTKGFIEGTGGSLTTNEKKYLLWGAKTMTFECGMRFLTDYLLGDTYFKISYPDHNLVRCRTQFKLVEDMENKWDMLEKIIKRY